MSWSTVIAFLQALPAIVKLLQSIADYAAAKAGEKAGRDAAVAEAALFAAQQLDEATKARQEAEAAHNAHPNDDEGFDPEFKRP